MLGQVDEQRRLDLRGFFGRGRHAVEGRGRVEIRQARGEQVGDASAVAEADHAQLAVAVRAACFRNCAAATKSSRVFVLIELGEELARLVLVAGIAAQREQRVGRVGDEALERQRRATSSMWGLRPRFSWTTSTLPELAVRLGGAHRVATAPCRCPAARG